MNVPAHEQIAANLARTLAPLSSGPVEISGLERLSGGASRETWAFVADGRPLILRRDPPGRPGLPGSMAREANAMRAARRAGLLAPEVLVDDDGALLGTAGLVMARVPGETIARKILRDDEFDAARRVLVEQIGAFLGGLHSIDPTEVEGVEAVDTLATYWDRYRQLDDVSPTFEAAFRWLDRHRPPASEPVVVHGDLRLGNVIVGPDGLQAVIDWELVHLGDPLEDLGWVCVKAWRFGAPLPVAGVGRIDQLLRSYEAARGRAVDEDAFHWWLVMNTLKWGIGCMGQAAVHLSGALRSVELAAIGRRVCEQEWDLLELVAPAAYGAARALPPDRGDGGNPGLHGRPTVAELAAAAREFLTDDVMGATDGRIQFHARVTANVLGIIERELALGPIQEARLHTGLDKLGVSSISELATAIAQGDFDERADELHDFLAATVRDRLSVANPRHLTR